MKTQLHAVFEKFNALNERERLAVMLLSVVAIIILFIELLILPINQQHDVVVKQIANLQTVTKQNESQLTILRNKKNRDPDFIEKQKIQLLGEQIANINVQLKEKMHGLIEPKQMAKVLEVVLAQNTDLKLQRVQSLEAEAISSLTEKEGEASETPGVYRHGLQIEFKGSYLSTLKYLKALDDLPWNFYWDVLDLNVEKYPLSTIVITVHTLSFHKGWIGV